MPTKYLMQGDLPPVLTVAQVQELLGLGKAKAYEVVHQAGFPALRFGKVIRVPCDAFFVGWRSEHSRLWKCERYHKTGRTQGYVALGHQRLARWLPRRLTEVVFMITHFLPNSHPPVHPAHDARKRDLVSLGLWALCTGRSSLVCAVHAALVRERLRHA